jgi:hypothetical protein
MLFNSLYWACKGFEFALRAIGSLVLLFLPSGIKIGMLIDDFVPDFRIDPDNPKKFWGYNLWIGGIPIVYRKPLPKEGIRSIWHAILGEKDIWIPNSQNYTYHKDDDGIWKPGSFFDPPKQYGILHHGVLDLGSAALVGVVGYLIYKSGLPQMAGAFLKNTISTGYKYTKIFKNMESAKGYAEITTDVDEMLDYFATHGDKLDNLAGLLGVRMVIR